MRISDWSSDVCSSDLQVALRHAIGAITAVLRRVLFRVFLEPIEIGLRGKLPLRAHPLVDEAVLAFYRLGQSEVRHCVIAENRSVGVAADQAALERVHRRGGEQQGADRRGGVEGKRGSVRVGSGGGRII